MSDVEKEVKDLEQFFDSRPGSIRPKDTKHWVEKVHATKDHIRHMIGGVSRTLEINVPDEQTPASTTDVDRYFWNINQYIPELGHKYGPELFRLPTMKFDGKEINVSTYVKRLIKNAVKEKRLGLQSSALIDDYLSGLGRIWQSYKAKAMKCQVHISTSPMAFALIGSYGADNSACWRQEKGRSDQNRKYTFGIAPNTFVISFNQENEKDPELPDNASNIGRTSGYSFCHADGVINTFNFYGKPEPFGYGSPIVPLKAFFSKLLGWDNISSFKDCHTVARVNGLYSNNHRLSFRNNNQVPSYEWNRLTSTETYTPHLIGADVGFLYDPY